MVKLSIDNDTLKKAMSVACLATSSENAGHCLFEFHGKTLKILSSDRRNLLSQSVLELPSEVSDNFTVDPRKILKLLKTSDTDSLTLQFDKDKATVQVFLSETGESYVSLPSLEPSQYTPVGDAFVKAYDLKTVNAGVLLEGIRFIKDFLEKKDKVFSNLYISNGVLYGSNGSNIAAAFSCPDLVGLDELVFPLSILTSIMSLINDLDLRDILIQTTSNNILFSSPDKNHTFGFTKVKTKMPKLPVSVKDPETNGWIINKDVLLKKIGCFNITEKKDLGVKGVFNSDVLQLTTIADRPSKDSMPCKKIKESGDTFFVLDCRLLEEALKQFSGTDLSFFVLEKKVIIYHKADLEITEKDTKILKSFTSVATVVRSKEEA